MKQLHIVICMKQVPDPEGPIDAFKVDSEAKRVTSVGIPPVINPFDENALEAALRIKDDCGAKITAISMGERLAQPVLRKALASGADELMILEDLLFKDLDNYSTAYVLSAAIRRLEAYDLILTGRQAGDWDFGVTGLLLAEILQIPGINLAQKLEIRGGRVLVETLNYDGYDVVEAPLPVVVTVSNEVGELRYASVRALQAVAAKPVKVHNAEDLGIDPRKLTVRQLINLSAFADRRQCRFIDGESPQEKGESLAVRMKSDGLI